MKMKKFLPYAIMVVLVFSCRNDDDGDFVAQCSQPSNIQATAIGIDSIELEWNDTNGPITFEIEYGPSGFVPGTGTTVTTDSRNLQVNGLEAGTSYDFFVKSICSIDNISLSAAGLSVSTMPPLVVSEFLQNLSELNIYLGNQADLSPSPYALAYELVTPLFTDYSHKDRLIALPQGSKMTYDGDGLPLFPDNTMIFKTFSYNYDETDLSQGRLLIETRVLLKRNGEWELGNYKWNADQTDAVLTTESSIVPVTYVDANGSTRNVNYEIPSAQDCFTCHNNADQETPIGPKLRNLKINGQLQSFIANGYIDGLLDASLVQALPKWDDEDNYTLEERARAYFEVNCAHCHIEGGFCGVLSNLRMDYETPFSETEIFNQRFNIMMRMQEYLPFFSMPYIGTTQIHTEGYELIEAYVNSLN